MEPPPLPPTTPSRDDDDGGSRFNETGNRTRHGHLARASQGHPGPEKELSGEAKMAARHMGETPMPPFRQPQHPAGSPAGAPLGDEEFALIREATVRRKAIRKAAKVAKGSATTTLIIGALAVPFVLLSFSWAALMMTAGLLVVGTVERRGHRLMLAADPAAPKLLARNQLAFLGLICIYCVWQIITAGTVEAVSPEFRAQLGSLPSYENMVNDIESLWPVILRGVYALVIVLTIAFQGGLAWYYHSRRRHVQAYLADTPDWVKRMMDEAAG